MPFSYYAVGTHRQTYREFEIVWATQRTRDRDRWGETKRRTEVET